MALYHQPPPPYTQSLTLSNRRARATFTFTISQEVKAGLYPLEFKLVYVAANGLTRQIYETTVTAYVRVLSDGVDYQGDDDDEKSLIVLGAADAPTARIEKDEDPPRVTLTLPLVNTSAALANVSIEPVISTDLDEFPFVVETQTYRQELGNFQAGQTRTVTYDFLLSEHATSGNKAIKFKLEYTQNGTKFESTVTAYVNIDRYKDDDDDDNDKTSKPKLIISSYTIEPDKVYAGTNFTLDLNFTNTSDETIQNITIAIVNANEENAYVVLARSGSNTIYVRSLGPGAVINRSLEMQVRPDTLAKPNMLLVTMDYENSRFDSYTETANITIPINQELRVVVDEPRFDFPYVDQGNTTYTYFNIVNMGKSKIYNCMVTVEGAGLMLEESLYVGSLDAGGQYNADVGIICNEAGDIEGYIIVSYEDDFGDVEAVRLPFTLYVSEPFIPEFDDMGMGEWDNWGMEEEGGGGGALKWILIGLGVAALVVVVLVVRKRKAKKRLAELEEEDEEESA